MEAELIVFLKRFQEKFYREEFTDTDDIFLLLVSGSFSLEAEGKKYTVTAGQGVLFRKGVNYIRRAISPITAYLFRYKSDSPLFRDDYVVFHNTERISSTVQMLDSLEFNPERQILGLHLLYDLVYQYEIEKASRIKKDAVIEAVVNKMKSSISETCALTDYAKESGLSYAQFHRRFKQYTGKSPLNYLIQIRLALACELLLDTNLSIREISLKCGFDNEYYFSNFFKMHKGVPPTVFRSPAL